MEVVAKTEYQDIYRVKDGVLLVVNKFTYIDYSDKTNWLVDVYESDRKKCSTYNKNCQKWLKVLKADYSVKDFSGVIITIPKGTVLYMHRPVIATDNRKEFQYEIKTTGDLFGGDSVRMMSMLNEIVKVLKDGE